MTVYTATYFGDDVTLRARTPRTVGDALVWSVESIYVGGDRTVGKVVLRDGFWFIRDLTSCGEPLIFWERGTHLESVLLHMADYLGLESDVAHPYYAPPVEPEYFLLSR